MNKIHTVLLGSVMALSLAACNTTGTGSDTGSDASMGTTGTGSSSASGNVGTGSSSGTSSGTSGSGESGMNTGTTNPSTTTTPPPTTSSTSGTGR